MCAILDNSVAGIVFQPDRPAGAREFLRWVEKGSGRLVVGGKLLRELAENHSVRTWLRQAILSGRAVKIPDARVQAETDSLAAAGSCRSNDEHVVALARVSGARLLYADDQLLEQDFKTRRLLDDPRGKVYPATKGTRCRRWLLGQRRLCASAE